MVKMSFKTAVASQIAEHAVLENLNVQIINVFQELGCVMALWTVRMMRSRAVSKSRVN